MVIRVAVILFNKLESNRFLSLFKIIQPRLNKDFELVNIENADIVIMEHSQQEEIDLEKFDDFKIGVVYGNSTNSNSNPNFLKINKPVKMAELVSVLNFAASKINQKKDNVVNSVWGKPKPEKTTTDIHKKIQNSKKYDNLLDVFVYTDSKKVIYIDNTVVGKLIIDMTQRDCFGYCDQSIDIVKKLITSNEAESSIEITELDRSQLVKEKAESNLSYWSLDELIWGLIFNQRQEKIIGGYTIDEVVRLKQWPNLTRMPHSPAQTRLCVLMFQGEDSLQNLIVKTQIPIQDAINFFNACVMTNLVIRCNQEVKRLPKAAHYNVNEQSVLSKLMNHFFG